MHEKATGLEDMILYHATCSRNHFKVPRGPAFFYLQEGTGEKYVKLYHLHDLAFRRPREQSYMIKANPTIVHSNTVSEEQMWVEQHSELRLPLVIRGRGSVIDRWPRYTKQIVQVYENHGIDGLYDDHHDIVTIFNPEKFVEYLESRYFTNVV